MTVVYGMTPIELVLGFSASSVAIDRYLSAARAHTRSRPSSPFAAR